jgi:hypothetical protein
MHCVLVASSQLSQCIASRCELAIFSAAMNLFFAIAAQDWHCLPVRNQTGKHLSAACMHVALPGDWRVRNAVRTCIALRTPRPCWHMVASLIASWQAMPALRGNGEAQDHRRA